MQSITSSIIVIVVMCATSLTTEAVTFDWVTVGNPSNPNDSTGEGQVDYTYKIARNEVTNAQYVEFLNAVAATDTFGLYNELMGSTAWGGITRSGLSGSYIYSIRDDAIGQGPGGGDFTYANKPVVYVSFYDAMRFVNWLQNGQMTGAQGIGTTEDGAYTISNELDEVRSANARFFIPSGDE